MPEIVQIHKENRALINSFLENAGKSLVNFRYFDKRSLDVLDNHLATFVITHKEDVVGYGHLDEEDEIVWLGVAVADKFQGFGLGSLMMHNLISTAKMMEVKNIRLAVDNDNEKAIRLYMKLGFTKLKEHEKFQFLNLKL